MNKRLTIIAIIVLFLVLSCSAAFVTYKNYHQAKVNQVSLHAVYHNDEVPLSPPSGTKVKDKTVYDENFFHTSLLYAIL